MSVIFFLLIGAVSMLAGFRMLAAGLKVRRWPVVPGRIIERGIGPATTTGASRPGRYFEPRVKYAYEVGGRTFVGRRIGLATAAYDEEKAARMAHGLPDTVEVHYDPRDPGNACLRPSSYMLASIGLLVGIVCLAIGVGDLAAR